MTWKTLILLAAISCAAILVHGYHPNTEDAAIYLPGVEKALNHELFPYNQQFFASHAHMTLYNNETMMALCRHLGKQSVPAYTQTIRLRTADFKLLKEKKNLVK
jgi:hypothetical protein